MRAEAADKYGHDERAAGKSQLNGLGHIHQRERSEQHTQSDTEEDGDKMRLAQLLERIAQHVRHLLDGSLITYDHHLVANLQLHALIRHKVDACTCHTRNVDSIARAQTQIGEGLAIDLSLGDKDTTRYKLRLQVGACTPLLLADLDSLTKECHHSLAIVGRADQTQTLANL